MAHDFRPFVTACWSIGMVFWSAWIAHRDNFLTVREMQRGGVRQGLPIIWHGPMWGDLLLISPLLTMIAAFSEHSVSTTTTIAVILLGSLGSMGMHWTYTQSKTPEAHVRNGKLTDAGKIHGVYMALALGMIIYLYFFMPSPPAWLVVSADIMLTIHVFVATHIPLYLIAKWKQWDWYPDNPVKNPMTWVVVTVVPIALGLRTWFLLS